MFSIFEPLKLVRHQLLHRNQKYQFIIPSPLKQKQKRTDPFEILCRIVHNRSIIISNFSPVGMVVGELLASEVTNPKSYKQFQSYIKKYEFVKSVPLLFRGRETKNCLGPVALCMIIHRRTNLHRMQVIFHSTREVQ